LTTISLGALAAPTACSEDEEVQRDFEVFRNEQITFQPPLSVARDSDLLWTSDEPRASLVSGDFGSIVFSSSGEGIANLYLHATLGGAQALVASYRINVVNRVPELVANRNSAGFAGDFYPLAATIEGDPDGDVLEVAHEVLVAPPNGDVSGDVVGRNFGIRSDVSGRYRIALTGSDGFARTPTVQVDAAVLYRLPLSSYAIAESSVVGYRLGTLTVAPLDGGPAEVRAVSETGPSPGLAVSPNGKYLLRKSFGLDVIDVASGTATRLDDTGGSDAIATNGAVYIVKGDTLLQVSFDGTAFEPIDLTPASQILTKSISLADPGRFVVHADPSISIWDAGDGSGQPVKVSEHPVGEACHQLTILGDRAVDGSGKLFAWPPAADSPPERIAALFGEGRTCGHVRHAARVGDRLLLARSRGSDVTIARAETGFVLSAFEYPVVREEPVNLSALTSHGNGTASAVLCARFAGVESECGLLRLY
jgi:hypothetical protein